MKARTMSPKRSFPSPRSRIAAFALAAGLATAPAAAEDIDIYGGAISEGMLPNVLLFLDNTSNWSADNQAWSAAAAWTTDSARARTTCTEDGVLDAACYSRELQQAQTLIETVFYVGVPQFGSTNGKRRPWQSGFAANRDDVSLKQGQVELRALRAVVSGSVCKTGATLKLKLGLMLFNDSGSVRSNGDRPGYIRRAVKVLNMTPPANGGPSSCDAMLADLDLIDRNITQSEFKGPSNADYGSALFEAFKYFGGHTYPGGTAAGSPTGALGYGPVRFSRPISLEDRDAFVDTASKTVYAGPIDPAGCARSYILVIGNGYPNSEPTAGPARFQGLGYTPPMLTEDPSRYADEWAQFLYNTDVHPAEGKQGVGTYTVNVFKDRPSAEQKTLLKSMAAHGGGEYVEVAGSLAQLFDTFNDLLIRLSSVDSVFTATTLPVSTTTQGTYLNQLFIGMFRPDGNGKPRWLGNLKQYALGLEDDGEVRVVDATGKRALNAGTGFFSPLARSYWTSDSIFFNNNKMGTPESASDSPDGQIVEKGGAAQRLREANLKSASQRRMYTLPAAQTDKLLLSETPFTIEELANDRFTADEISWIRGENNVTESPGKEYAGAVVDPTTGLPVDLGPTGARPSMHGDILHSRPVAVNYGNGKVVVYYGSNDGTLHAVDGSRSGATAGQELWSFIAPEHYGMLRRQRENTPSVFVPSTDDRGEPVDPIGGAQSKDYAFDGPIGLFATYTPGTSPVLKQARIYATMRRGGRSVYAFDVSDSNVPAFLWKISNETAGFGLLAQTWSMPRPVILPGKSDPILIMGGGYDPAEDTNGTGGIGNRIYVINGTTGTKLHELPTDFSVPGDVTVVDSNGDRVFDRAYAADVRGNLYRINMTNSAGTLLDPSGWTIKKIARLNGKVFYAPDVVVTKSYIAVLAGTGDREKPLLLSTNDNFFLVKDTRPGEPDRTEVIEVSDMTRVARVSESSTSEAKFTDVSTGVNDAEGCYLGLSTLGEKVVNAPFTIAGVVYFGTNRPTPDLNSCTGSRGQARAYQFPLFCGAPKGSVLETGGMPPSTVGGLVTITDKSGKDTLVPFVIGAGTDRSAFEAERPRPPMAQSRRRNYWYIQDGNR